MDRVFLIGRLARTPELRTTISGESVCKFSLAVSRPRINGEDRGADFISCTAWRKKAEVITKYCEKGTLISVEGRIQTGSYDGQDGKRKYTMNIVVEEVKFLGHSRNKEIGQQSGPETRQQFNTNQEAFSSAMSEKSDPFSEFGSEIELNDDDLPF